MPLERSARPIYRHLQPCRNGNLPIRTLATAADSHTTSQQPPPPPSSKPPPNLNPNLVHTPRSERKLIATKNQYPIASRRRRAALAQTPHLPFTQLPYQCFQEARKVLAADRTEKMAEITRLRDRIATIEATGDGTRESEQGERGHRKREHMVQGLRQRLEQYKIYADANDPLVKKRFEDGQGDMRKPIYRLLAHRQWSEYRRKVLLQRLEQMNAVPDVLPAFEPSIAGELRFGRKRVPHGAFVDARVSESAPNLTLQAFDAGERLVALAVVNPDVPDVASDGFGYRCHFLAVNIPLSPTETEVDLSALDLDTQVLMDWLPAYAQKGLKYQRMCVFVLQQHAAVSAAAVAPGRLDVEKLRQDARNTTREDFSLRGFVAVHRLKPVGADLFRTQWDESTAGVMERAGIVGADVEFKRKRVEPLPYKRLKGERFT